MPKKRFSAEQIVMLLRQNEVLMSQGKATLVARRDSISCKKLLWLAVARGRP